MPHEFGPIYGAKLSIESLPVGGMLQAMPTRADLEQVAEVNERVAAAFEVLLWHYVNQAADPMAAERIANDLFTDGMGRVASRLVMDYDGNANGVGWSRAAAIDRILRVTGGRA